MRKGIDVSKWQGIIDWKQVGESKVGESRVEFAILKIIDKKGRVEEAFERNYAGAKEQGLPISVYDYSYATSKEKAAKDAETVIAVAKNRNIEYIWLDIEDECQKGIGKTLIDIINAYQKAVEDAGYSFGIYTDLSFYNSYIAPFASFVDCPFWIARYPSIRNMDLSMNPEESKKPAIKHKLWGWQYSSAGKVAGIKGNVDLTIAY